LPQLTHRRVIYSCLSIHQSIFSETNWTSLQIRHKRIILEDKIFSSSCKSNLKHMKIQKFGKNELMEERSQFFLKNNEEKRPWHIAMASDWGSGFESPHFRQPLTPGCLKINSQKITNKNYSHAPKIKYVSNG